MNMIISRIILLLQRRKKVPQRKKKLFIYPIQNYNRTVIVLYSTKSIRMYIKSKQFFKLFQNNWNPTQWKVEYQVSHNLTIVKH